MTDIFCPRQINFSLAGSPGVLITATENGAGGIDFIADVKEDPRSTGDLRALYFHLVDESKLTGLTVTGGDGFLTEYRVKANSILDLDDGTTMAGAVKKGFDVGIEFGTPGTKPDDLYKPIHFTVSDPANNLTLDDIAHMQFGAKLDSVGGPGGPRTGATKLLGSAPAAPDAKDDAYTIHEDGSLTPTATPQAVTLNVLANDTDADARPLTITEVHLSGTPHGTVAIAADGKSLLYTPTADYAGPNTDPNSVDDTFQYCVSDGNGGEDHATVNLHVIPVADTPLVNFELLDAQDADPVGEIRLRVTAQTTDVDGSETISPLTFGTLPAGVTLTEGPLNHTTIGGLDAVTEDVQLFLPEDKSTSFDLKVTATATENGVGDPDATSATASKHVELSFTHTVTPESFHTEGKSIWDPSLPGGFNDDRFIGIDVSGDPSETFIVPGLPPTVVDAEVNYHLRTGFESHLHVDLGQITADLTYDVVLDGAYNKTTDTLKISPTFNLTGGTFHTTGPEGDYHLDFVFNLGFHPDVSVDGLPVSDIFGDIFDIETGPFTQTILPISSHDPALPFTVPLPSGLSITLDWPHISTDGSLSGANDVSSTATSNDFVQLGLDVDQAAAFWFPILAPLTTLNDAEDFEWLDLDLFGGANVVQNFLLHSNGLSAKLTFEDGSVHDVVSGTPIVIHHASTLDADHDGIEFGLAVSPLATLHNDTELGFDVGYSFDLLKNIPIVDDTLYHAGGNAEVGSFSVYDHTFDLTGFNTQHVDWVV